MLETWARLGDAPFARVNHQSIFLNGSLYVFGGFNSQLRDINYSCHQLDVFKWNVQHNKWEELKYPLRLKAWDCNSKTWTSDPLSSADGSINPTLRFGHTVVAWRGRGWLFGGRTQQHVCPNQLYLFEPGYYNWRSSEEPTAVCTKKPHTTTTTTTTVDIVHPCWAEVVGTTGAAPSPRDGHAATVLENAMFIFGGFEDVFGSYDNFVYRFDFITWSWTRVQIHQQPSSGLIISSGNSTASIFHGPQMSQGGADPNFLLAPAAPAVHQPPNRMDDDVDADAGEQETPTTLIVQTDVPLPRDFSCLISHQGRLFLFGGRSELSARSGYDVYDSALWELVPLQVNESVLTTEAEQATAMVESVSSYCYTPIWPNQCEYCSPERLHGLAAQGSLQRMAWEEETGNWTSPEFWATAPPRPCCLWRCSGSVQPWDACEGPTTDTETGVQKPNRLVLSSTTTGCRSRWSSGNATWLRRHPGHGLQLPDQLLPRLSQTMTNSHLVTTSSPHGRRSLSHWAYGGYLYIAFGTVRCQTGEQWQLHYHDVWRFSLAENTWTQIATERALSTDPLTKIHWPSARRRAVANLYIPCPRVSPSQRPDHVPTLFRPVVYVFGGTQPRVLDRRNAVPGAPGGQRSSLAAPARPYTLFTSGIPHVASPGEPVTQNQLLGLGDGDSVSLLHFPPVSSACAASLSSCHTITSPMAILLVNSPRTFHAEQSTPFYLVVIVPSHLPASLLFGSGSHSPTQPCAHQSTLSHLCVVSFAELAALFRAPGSDCASPLPVADSMCYGALDKLLYTSEPDWDTEPDPQQHHAQLYTALRVAWFAVLNRGQSSDSADPSCVDAVGGSRLHMMIVQQQQLDAAQGDAGRQHRNLIGDSFGELSFTPLILEQHSYILAPDGQVFRENMDCVQGFLWFTLLPLVCSALITTVDLLLESTRRLLACLRQGNLRSFVLGPLVFRSAAPCPDCSATDSTRPVHVWIDSSQLTGLIPVPEPTGSGRQSGGHGSRECRHQTIASLLIQFLPHLRSTLELEFATQNLSGGSSTSGLPQEPMASTSTDCTTTFVTNYPSGSAGQIMPQTLLSDTCTTVTENNNSVLASCSIVESSFAPTADLSIPASPPSTDGTMMLIDASPPLHPPPASSSVNLQPAERRRPGAGSEDSSDSDGLEEFFDQFFAGDEDPVSSDSDDAATGGDTVVVTNRIGALVRGKERLMELADCYVMHLDTTLYDLCLRRLRALGPSRSALLTLPTKIINDLKRLYYNPSGPELSGRKSNSG